MGVCNNRGDSCEGETGMPGGLCGEGLAKKRDPVNGEMPGGGGGPDSRGMARAAHAAALRVWRTNSNDRVQADRTAFLGVVRNLVTFSLAVARAAGQYQLLLVPSRMSGRVDTFFLFDL
ncbi:hypothetical protein ACFFSY_34655 [Paenibacillus aurantiacus]|uniref:Uncharacterized protein n=1 Tax=Paenibacillus aurantiacus TaxID=1936118 RepID=A0ABV5L0V6_9BACL